jgi:phage/plasmid-related protein TIGR03299
MPANVERMFYVGEMPWHRQGVQLKEPPDTITAIKNAGLNWGVSKVKIYTESRELIKGYYGIKRNDNNKIIGVVKKSYVPLQNFDAFSFFDPLLENKFIEYETAGSIGEGEIIWILAKIKDNGSFKVFKDDEINKYLLLSNSHDGQSAVSIKFTPIRVVCQNTLNIALDMGETTRIKHITNMYEKLEDTQIAVQNILSIYSNIEEKFKAMVSYKITEKKAKEYFNSLYPIKDERLVTTQDQADKRAMSIKIQNKLIKNFNEGFGVKEIGIGGTLWAAYNAVTQYIDHPVNYKLGDNKLLKRIWFGDGEVIKKKAYTKALSYIEAA